MRILYKLIMYSGIVAITLLLATFVLGITGINFKLHKILGISTMAVAAIHGGLILYRMIKIKISQNLFR